MEQKNFSEMTDEALLIEKKKLKKAKITSAMLIGFLGGVLGFGMVGWILNPDRKIGFLIPMIIPVVFIYKMIKNRKNNKPLENMLKDRNLN